MRLRNITGSREMIGESRFVIHDPKNRKNRWREFARYPQYKDAYIRAFAKMLAYREACGNKDVIGWKTPEGVFDWWMEDQSMEGQVSMVIEGNVITGFREKGGV